MEEGGEREPGGDAVDVGVTGWGREDPTPPESTCLAEPDPDCGSYSPAEGLLAGGDDVIETAVPAGELDVLDEVRLGGVPAIGLIHANESQLAVTTPEYPAAEDVAVELLRDGEVMSTCPSTYTYR